MACVNKVVHPLLTTKAGFRLSEFIVVMGKLEIFTTSVNVNGFAQNVRGRDGALCASGRVIKEERETKIRTEETR
jgi:hypothetical protein